MVVGVAPHWAYQPHKRFYNVDDEFYNLGNEQREAFFKRHILHESDACDDVCLNIPCSVVGCDASFTSTAAHELHFAAVHRHVCHTCQRTYLSEKLLNLHVSEIHDSYFFVASSRRAMFECIVDGCKVLSFDRAQRKLHLVQVHKFPASFRFDGGMRALQSHWKHYQSQQPTTLEHRNRSNDSHMVIDEPVEESMGRSRVPGSICFGRRSNFGRGFISRGGGRGDNGFYHNSKHINQVDVPSDVSMNICENTNGRGNNNKHRRGRGGPSRRGGGSGGRGYCGN